MYKKKSNSKEKKRFILTFLSKCYYVLAIAIFRTLKLCKLYVLLTTYFIFLANFKNSVTLKRKLDFTFDHSEDRRWQE